MIHRDLKPGNIMVTPAGLVKVLDFGIARREQVAQHETTLTVSGGIQGTPAYMSPEQASGKEVDRRSDIFSFGCVLYEMLTGRRPFEGDTQISVLAAILEKEPAPMSGVTSEVNRVLARCLRKDPELRFQDMGDVRVALEEVREESKAEPPVHVPEKSTKLPWLIACVAVFAAILSLWALWRPEKPTISAPSEVSFVVVPPAMANSAGLFTIRDVDKLSPDGTMIQFRNSDGKSYLRRLSSFENQAFSANFFGFWSADSQSMAYSVNEGVMKLRAPKGTPELVAKGSYISRGGSWGEKGTLLFSQSDWSVGNDHLYSVPATGGTAALVEVPDLKSGAYYHPFFLPGGEDFLFLFFPSDSETAQICMATLRGVKGVNVRVLFSDETSAVFTPAGGGRILFVRNDNLYSQKLDLGARKLLGDPELVQDGVASLPMLRMALFFVSRNGTVAWRSGSAMLSQVAVFDRKGNRIGVAGPPASIGAIRLSPDESHLIAMSEAGFSIMDAEGTGRAILNLRAEARAFWSPGSSSVIFVRDSKLIEHRLSGSERILANVPEALGGFVSGLSQDGRRILIGTGPFKSSIYELTEEGTLRPVGVEVKSGHAALSPDGSWVVYRVLTGPAMYAHPVSGSELPRPIATSGDYPTWRGDGKEILFQDGSSISSISVESSSEGLRFGAPAPLFAVTAAEGMANGSHPLAVNHDGSRIYFLQSPEQPADVIKVRFGAIR